MINELSRCICCGKNITPQFWVCADCEKQFDLAGSWKHWPEWARVLRNDVLRNRRLLKKQLVNIADSEDVAEYFDLIAYGGENPDFLPDTEVNKSWLFAFETSPLGVGQKVRCVACSKEYLDDKITWPLPATRWLEPACPNCGIVHYEELENQADSNGEASARDTVD